jgi:hypothetical protein
VVSGSPSGRVDRILENYLLALAGVDQCDASAAEETKTRLAANAARAERAWADANADGLVDLAAPAVDDLAALDGLVRRARAALLDGEPIAGLLEALEAGTDRAMRVVAAALGG